MKLPLRIEFRDIVPLPSLEPEIRRRAAKLEQFMPDLMSCTVVVESSANRHRQGHVYTVKVDVRVPGEEIVTGDHHRHQNIALAVHGAFDAMARRLEDLARRRRGQVKHHEVRRDTPGDGAADSEGPRSPE